MSFRRNRSPGFRCFERRMAMVSAAEGEGAHARMWIFWDGVEDELDWERSWRIASMTVFVFPVPGGPDMRKGTSP